MIDQEFLRQTVRVFIANEGVSTSRWGTQGDPPIPQSTLNDFLNGRRNASRDTLIKLCARMRLEPQNFYKSKNVDVLKQRLGLLNKMMVHPDFPFGQRGQFEGMAALVETVYSHVFKLKENESSPS